MRRKSTGLLAVLALIAISCGGGAPNASGPSEGIAVHGDWTIEVFNEDGSLDQHVEFKNALVQGDAELALLLTGQATASGLWTIEFGTNSNSTVCPLGANGRCIIGGVAAQEGFGSVVTLEGTSSVEADGTVDTVLTRMGKCAPSVAPADCPTDFSNQIFSQKILDPADQVTVTANQVVTIQVEFSFTSG